MRSPVFFFQKMELQLSCQLAQEPWQPSLGQLCLLVNTFLMEYLYEHQKLVQTVPSLIEITVIWGPLHRYLFKEDTLLLTLYTEHEECKPKKEVKDTFRVSFEGLRLAGGA